MAGRDIQKLINETKKGISESNPHNRKKKKSKKATVKSAKKRIIKKRKTIPKPIVKTAKKKKIKNVIKVSAPKVKKSQNRLRKVNEYKKKDSSLKKPLKVYRADNLSNKEKVKDNDAEQNNTNPFIALFKRNKDKREMNNQERKEVKIIQGPAVSEQNKDEPKIKDAKQEEPHEKKQGFFAKLFSKKKSVIKEEEKDKNKKQAIQSPQKEKGRLFSIISAKLSSSIIKEVNVNAIFQDFEMVLIENKVGPDTVTDIKKEIYKDLVGVTVKKEELRKEIIKKIKETIGRVMVDSPNIIADIKKSSEPYAIIFLGPKKAGKTTAIGQMASLLQENSISCVLAAADTSRTGAAGDLDVHAKNLDLPLTKGDYNVDPVLIVQEAVKYAEENKIQCILIDTIGITENEKESTEQIKKIIKQVPNGLKMLVEEADSDKLAIQSKKLNDQIGVDGIILTKAEEEYKWGPAFSIEYAIKKPVYFIAAGKAMSELSIFKKKDIFQDLTFV